MTRHQLPPKIEKLIKYFNSLFLPINHGEKNEKCFFSIFFLAGVLGLNGEGQMKRNIGVLQL